MLFDSFDDAAQKRINDGIQSFKEKYSTIIDKYHTENPITKETKDAYEEAELEILTERHRLMTEEWTRAVLERTRQATDEPEEFLKKVRAYAGAIMKHDFISFRDNHLFLAEKVGDEDDRERINEEYPLSQDGATKYIRRRFSDLSMDYMARKAGVEEKLLEIAARRAAEMFPSSPFRQYIGKDGIPWGGYNVLRNGGPFNDMMLTAGKRGRKEKTSIDGVAVDAKVYKNMPFGSERIIMPVVTGAGGQSMLTHIMGLFAARCPKDASIQQIEKARHIKVYVDDFMESCGLTYEKKAIEKMRKYFLWLQTSIIEWSGTVKDRDDKGNAKTQAYKGKDGKNHKRTIKTESRLAGAILGQVELSGKEGYTPAIFHDNDGRKYFKVSINMDFAKHNAYSPVMPYYSKLAQIDFQKFPSAIYLANRMLMHYNMNQGKQNEGILSNKILLGASNLPSYDSLARKTTRKKTNGKEVDYISKGNNWMRDIVEPLEKNLDELQRVGMICRWEFCSSNGRPLNDNAFSLFREFESAFTSFEIDKHIQ